MDLPWQRARDISGARAPAATAARNMAAAQSIGQHAKRRTCHRAFVPIVFDQEMPRLQLWRKPVQAGLTQGSRPPRGLNGRRGRAADAITANVDRRAKLIPRYIQAADDDRN
jgi:hypothetical protein